MLTATDKGTIRIVVVAVALLALVCVGAVVTLTIIGDAVPPVLDVTTGTSVGALVALLSSTRSGAGGQEAVQAAVMAQGVAAVDQPLPTPGDQLGGALVTLADQGIDPLLGHPASADYPKNLNADPAQT